jgi:hypothetical protein
LGCDLTARHIYVHYQLADERISQLLELAEDLLADVVCSGYQQASRNQHPEKHIV